METELPIETRSIDDDILTVILRGNLDASTIDAFNTEIQRHIDEGRTRIILDSRYQGLMSSLGVGSALIHCASLPKGVTNESRQAIGLAEGC